MSNDIRKNQVLTRNTIEQNEHEPGPVHARRVVSVDANGNFVGLAPDHPLYVALSNGSITIETLNAQLDVHLSAKDNDPKLGDIHASVRIGDGIYELKVNPDGSINVTEVTHSNPIYNAASGTITASTNTEIYSYTSTDDTTKVVALEAHVSTPALIQVLFDGVVVRERWTSPLERNAIFEFKEPRILLNGKRLSIQAKVERFIWPQYETFVSLEGYLG